MGKSLYTKFIEAAQDSHPEGFQASRQLDELIANLNQIYERSRLRTSIHYHLMFAALSLLLGVVFFISTRHSPLSWIGLGAWSMNVVLNLHFALRDARKLSAMKKEAARG